MSKFKPADSYESEPTPLTENRRHLAAKIVERDSLMDAAKAETESSAKLGTVHDAVTPARAALAAFDAQTAIAWSNWSRGLVNGKPMADAARRAELAAELADAELSSAAAKAVQDECQAAVERMSEPLAHMNAKIRELAKVVAIEEEASALLPQIAEAIATAESLRLRLEAARAEAVEGLEYGISTMVNPAVERFDAARRAAESRPFQPPVNPFADGWRKFVAGLTEDPAVDFDGAQAMDVAPTPIRASMIDPVSAAAAAVESFQSNGFVR